MGHREAHATHPRAASEPPAARQSSKIGIHKVYASTPRAAHACISQGHGTASVVTDKWHIARLDFHPGRKAQMVQSDALFLKIESDH